jgi:hypothetical protein
VRDGDTGLLVDRSTPEAFAERMDEIERRAFPADRLVEHARAFSTARFETQFRELVAADLAAAHPC